MATAYIQQQDRSSCHVNTVLNYATHDTYCTRSTANPNTKMDYRKYFRKMEQITAVEHPKSP